MTERTTRKLNIWKKVEDCEAALNRVREIDGRVNKLVAVEKLLRKRRELNNP